MKKYLLVGFISLLSGFSIGGYFFKQKSPGGFTTDSISIVNPAPISTIKPEIKWLHDTVYQDTGSYQTVLIHDSIPVLIPLDTPGIVADYLLERNYVIDTTVNDIHAIMKPTVFSNKLILFDASFVNLKQCPEDKWDFKAGMMFGVNELTPTIQVDYKKWSGTAGFDLMGQEKGVRFGLLYDF